MQHRLLRSLTTNEIKDFVKTRRILRAAKPSRKPARATLAAAAAAWNLPKELLDAALEKC